MKRSARYAVGIATALGLGLAVAATFAQSGMGPGMGMGMGMGMGGMGMGQGRGMGPGMGMGRGMGMTAMLTTQDAGSAADMAVVQELLVVHDRIDRTVTRLPDGIRTVTESDDPQVAQKIQAHVASMSQRLADGREFNLFSNTLPVLFQNRDRIESKVEMTGKGAIVTRTSSDPAIVAALQGHAAEVTELVDDGMAAMHRGMMTRMAMGGHRH
jgi:hypothetical protein